MVTGTVTVSETHPKTSGAVDACEMANVFGIVIIIILLTAVGYFIWEVRHSEYRFVLT